ncbi:glycoside hydrolase family 32 protein [Subdoligranulum variabile]|uniref:beta-fructofuranosidase n=1 Tax=Subdoligranulum variabile DSM 15176 TaxID=411471 RepID=D1PN83_9FIRM|nr:glycoside hydrolase family 32 protein [Subdoligranulum variabile]EFB76018.1 sucrose-6-phosphate hydrolase [Subdoligranulum variabile DSM 15176]UWP68672.1 glycoside hydrolase family 32 protein [Subdoligranulum variabile]
MPISKKQSWHIEPPWGLLNDPNGLVWYKGNYYAFFQWNRFAKDHSSKAWGFATSPDLVHWQFRGSALLPDQLYDAQGVYSGSALEIDGRLCLYYTGNAKQQGRRISHQCLAISTDGRHFRKEGPLFAAPAGYTGHFRDPKVLAVLQGGYQMVVGAQRDNGLGAVVLYTSPDGFRWSYGGVVGTSREYQMIECPELFRLEDAPVLLYCPQHRDNAADTSLDSFSVGRVLDQGPDASRPLDLDTGWQRLDEGFDFYAPQTFRTPDGRRILFAWMSRLEGEAETAFGAGEPRIHCLTMPRELFRRGQRLCQRPVRELRELPGTPVPGETTESGRLYRPFRRAFRFTATELAAERNLDLTLHEGEWSFHYDAAAHTVTVERRCWTGPGQDTRTVPLSALSSLELWCDQSSAELFLNGGEQVFSARIWPASSQASLLIAGLPPESPVQLTLLPDDLYRYLPKEEETQ